jgi:DNA-binding MarR family transcriptional regulator
VSSAAPAASAAPGEAAATTAHKRADLRLWLRMLATVNLIEGELRRRLRARFGVTLPRFDLLAQLAKAPHGLTLSEVSRRMMVSNGNVTGLVERLVEDGLVARRASPDDRRSAIVGLTEAGRRSFEEMAAEHAEWVAELFGDLTPPAKRQLMDLFGRTKASVAAHTKRPAE